MLSNNNIIYYFVFEFVPYFFIFAIPKTWSLRLSVRTPGFHPGKRGSTPLGTTGKVKTLVNIS